MYTLNNFENKDKFRFFPSTLYFENFQTNRIQMCRLRVLLSTNAKPQNLLRASWQSERKKQPVI